ncbi:hypothetical protein [Paenibacillus gallinarum]|uniref:Uncharacterized protein n=1 Tax=Paenibacillus gallinarum TaxID=2762232 RepID=A0ABR8T0Z8_9BACL|nr:hypothetical protein [Paenibacillus gallinarum]MBD7969440.1 hypothetical protein [Paenibacillus gallinarum]
MVGRIFGRNESKDEYENQGLWNESQGLETSKYTEQSTDPSLYSVLIHFTPQAPFIYLIENDVFEVNEGVAFIDSDLHIAGTFVCQNGLKSMEEVEDFLSDYQLINPIRIDYC